MKKLIVRLIFAAVLFTALEICCVAETITVKQIGGISEDGLHKGDAAACSLSGFPSTLAEFKALQAKAAVTPQGAVAVYIAAMQLYKENEKDGFAAIKLASRNMWRSDLTMLQDKLRGKANDGYTQKFLPLAYLKGATPENSYKPKKPYTVEVSVNDARPYTRLACANANVIYLNVKTKGTDMGVRPCEVIKPAGSNYFVMNSAAGLLLQVKEPKKK